MAAPLPVNAWMCSERALNVSFVIQKMLRISKFVVILKLTCHNLDIHVLFLLEYRLYHHLMTYDLITHTKVAHEEEFPRSDWS